MLTRLVTVLVVLGSVGLVGVLLLAADPPTGIPTGVPKVPTGVPTGIPTGIPTGVPTGVPTGAPSPAPTTTPATASAPADTEKEAQTLLDQVTQQIKDKKFDLAQEGLTKLQGMKGLSSSMTDQIKAAQTALNAAKAAGGGLKLP